MKGRIRTVFEKELVDNARDRRSVLSALIMPLLMPAFMVALLMVAGRSLVRAPVEGTLVLPVQGAEYASGLMQFLQQNGAEVIPAPPDARAQVQAGLLDLVLIIPPDYAETFRSGQPAAVQLVEDTSRQATTAIRERLRTLLDAYDQQIAALRLLARGVNPSVVTPLAVQSVDVATPRSQTAIFLNMMPFLIMVVIFTGGMYVVIDTTAGERERSSLEALLTNPVSSEDLVLGKLLASLPFAVGTVVVALLAFALAFNVAPIEKYTGIPINVDWTTLGSIFLVSLPLILLASGLQMVIASFTRSFKEAQTYLAVLPLVAGLPGAFLTFLPVSATAWTMLIPVFGQSILIQKAMRGETINPEYFALSTLVTLALSLVLILLAIRLYQSEQVLFGKG